MPGNSPTRNPQEPSLSPVMEHADMYRVESGSGGSFGALRAAQIEASDELTLLIPKSGFAGSVDLDLIAITLLDALHTSTTPVKAKHYKKYRRLEVDFSVNLALMRSHGVAVAKALILRLSVDGLVAGARSLGWDATGLNDLRLRLGADGAVQETYDTFLHNSKQKSEIKSDDLHAYSVLIVVLPRSSGESLERFSRRLERLAGSVAAELARNDLGEVDGFDVVDRFGQVFCVAPDRERVLAVLPSLIETFDGASLEDGDGEVLWPQDDAE